MRYSAIRRQRLQRACERIHDRSFTAQRYVISPTPPPPPGNPAKPEKSHKERLEERFQQAVQKEFSRLGIG